MPVLHFIGKEKIVNHHREVPFRNLDLQYTFPSSSKKEIIDSENKIIHGDNLEALKSLLPEYAGKIKCIYIDPPYNTGNENWVYNDNVNDPRIRKWLAQTVGKEGEDLSRHDKWLCMMYPRLALLHQLLADDGVIFISIDDNEQANLKLLMDEIFGRNNFICSFVWEARSGQGNTVGMIAEAHEYIHFFAKNKDNTSIKKIEKIADEGNYSDDKGSYKREQLRQWGQGDRREDRPSMFFSVTAPDGTLIFPKRNDGSDGRWRVSKDKMETLIKDDDVDFVKDEKNNWSIYKKIRAGRLTYYSYKTILNTYGTASTATIELKKIFNDKIFNTPKPIQLISLLVDISTTSDSIILDSFAGSGTTAHAVLNLNQQEGGNRKFILIEMEDYADKITAERVKRVITGYGEGNSKVEGTGGNFSYYTLGEPVFVGDSINSNLTWEKLANYIYMVETTEKRKSKQQKENKAFLGVHENRAYYLHYDGKNTQYLDFEFLKSIQTKADAYIIYADACLLSESFLLEKNIYFKKIPNDIPRM